MKKVFAKSIPHQEASRQLALELCESYLPADQKFTLFLEGGLGAGKTFLVREILKQLGVTEDIPSPTYALVNEYTTDQLKRYAHFDFYRLENPNDFFARGFTDIVEDPQTSCLVEWPEKLSSIAKSAFGGVSYTLKIEFGLGVGMRKVTLLQK